MQPPLPSLTKTWHNDTYAAISPTRPELSAAGKTVIITGGGSGIGRATAHSFARAGAKRIILLGRTESKLRETEQQLSSVASEVAVEVYPTSVTDETTLRTIAKQVGTWDILILGAGYAPAPVNIQDADVDEWWGVFEARPMVTSKSFLPTANHKHSAIISLTSGPLVLPPAAMPGLSSYFASKLAGIKVLEFIGASNPNVFTASLHPGCVETENFHRSGATRETVPVDTPELSADFTVWLASREASFLNGRQVWVNWDVEELKGKTEEIQSGLLLTAGVYGWPYAP
ncbi:uncharacterized protein DSM5745_00158 [Aspergillus mulundensis]|uniref:Short chain dehydrogenase n=1 Tax=Aspergillus mulundensis TaxID=1810919 RepID=A0A3D8T2P6_9EURO|nr:Uncharacterized protein DSM5745_00158 [Aspergillus mulundensis]RDW92836.1 Uncharacterized protein DSM5745_00158 [Aspergillus mulundensis]